MRPVLVVALVCLACGSRAIPGVDGGSAGGGSGGSSGGGSTGGAGGGSAGGTAGGTAGGAAGGAAGGSAGGGAASCGQVEVSYVAAVQAAKRCPLNALVNPCTETRPAIISCGCPTFVVPGTVTEIDRLQAHYTDAGCVMTVCPRCAALDAGTCEPTDAGTSEGLCVDRF